MFSVVLRLSIACVLTTSLGAFVATAATIAPAAAAQKKPSVAAKPPPKPAGPPIAAPEQIEAAALVYYGMHQCEFSQSLEIAKNPRHTGYVDVKHGKANYLMKPVLSSTGAIRLEDTKGLTMLVQIATKSMLMNVKAGQRIVDDCIGAQQREAIEVARQVKADEEKRTRDAAQAAAAAQSAASAPDTTTPASPPLAEPTVRPEAASAPATR